MATRKSKINEIRNINLIYVFSTDSVFKQNTNKYVGIKLVYNENSVIETDYNDPNFGLLIQRVIERYKKEKNSRNIILLGELTKKLVNDASFYVLEETKEKKQQIPYYSYENKLYNQYKSYIFQCIYLIMKQIFKYETFNIQSIDGYNNNFQLNYSISGVNRHSQMLIYQTDDKLNFKIGLVDGSQSDILGSVQDKNGKIVVSFDYDKYQGLMEYNPLSNDNIQKISTGNEIYYYNDHLDTVLETDIERIQFYSKIIGFSITGKILKIDDNTFLAGNEEVKDVESQVLFTQYNTFVNLDRDIVRIIQITREGFSKYDGFINVELDKKVSELNIRKYYENNKKYLIFEKVQNGDYRYAVMELDQDLDLRNQFDYKDKVDIDITSINDIKSYKKEVRK